MVNLGEKHPEKKPSIFTLPNILPYTSNESLVPLATIFSDKLSTVHTSIYISITLVVIGITSLGTRVLCNQVMVSTMQYYYLQLQQHGNTHGMQFYQVIRSELAQFSTGRLFLFESQMFLLTVVFIQGKVISKTIILLPGLLL